MLPLWWRMFLIGAALLLPASASAQSGRVPPAAKGQRCLRLELYVQGEKNHAPAAEAELQRFTQSRAGLSYRRYDLDENEADEKRVSQICQYYKIPVQMPLVYGCGRPVVGFKDAVAFRQQLNELVTITAFVRAGCSHCAAAKAYLPGLLQRYPGFQVRYREPLVDALARRDMEELVRQHKTAAASFPVFHICGELLVGFDTAATTGPRLEAILKRWTRDCPADPPRPPAAAPVKSQSSLPPGAFRIRLVSTGGEDNDPPPDGDALPLPGEPELPLPLPGPEGEPAETASQPPPADVTLPVFGELRVEQIGLPLFTLAIGLVDGFNPCAMWVLMFLLSILVNLRSRWKILSVAGTFVFISGAAYFAFMAAWLNVFLVLGMVTWVRLTLATLAIVMGVIHVKDFFAFKRGLTLSIPESARPGIYERVRRIVTAENLAGAVVGAAVLAVLVNMLELLCTAGLPALYTQVLMAQQLPSWQNYAYLLLYIAAYMFDDALMVAVVVVTLERHKMQETHGRWLKLVSGLAILALGLIMLLRPEWIGMST